MIIKTMIDYVENNLLNEINFSQLEKITYYNKYNLMRIFPLVPIILSASTCGYAVFRRRVKHLQQRRKA